MAPINAPKVELLSQLQGNSLKSTLALTQWSSNFFARGTLKSPIFFGGTPKYVKMVKLDTETLYNMKFMKNLF